MGEFSRLVKMVMMIMMMVYGGPISGVNPYFQKHC